MATKAKENSKVYLSVVDNWLDKLPAADSEDFREFAEVTPSIIEIWVYSGILGFGGGFNDLARWVKMKYKKLNRREILNSEIAALHSDIQDLRMAITSGEIKGDNGCARLAALEKELRFHMDCHLGLLLRSSYRHAICFMRRRSSKGPRQKFPGQGPNWTYIDSNRPGPGPKGHDAGTERAEAPGPTAAPGPESTAPAR